MNKIRTFSEKSFNKAIGSTALNLSAVFSMIFRTAAAPSRLDNAGFT